MWMKLSDIKVGEEARVTDIRVNGDIKRRLYDIGLIPGTIVKAVMQSPFGEPIAYNIRGSIIAIRKEDTSKILVEVL